MEQVLEIGLHHLEDTLVPQDTVESAGCFDVKDDLVLLTQGFVEALDNSLNVCLGVVEVSVVVEDLDGSGSDQHHIALEKGEDLLLDYLDDGLFGPRVL